MLEGREVSRLGDESRGRRVAGSETEGGRAWDFFLVACICVVMTQSGQEAMAEAQPARMGVRR